MFRAGRHVVEAREWTRTGRTVTTMGELGRLAWTAAVLAPSVPGVYLLVVGHMPFGVLGPFFSLVAGYAVLPSVWARGRR